MKNNVIQIFLGLIFLILFCSTLLPQQVKIERGILSGQVKEENGTPLIGAHVRIEKTLLGSATSRNGTFRITKVPAGLVSVRISMIGYETKLLTNIEIKPNEETKLEIVLRQSAIETNEVFVTASRYEQKISEIPVSVSLINSKELSLRSIIEFDDALRYVPGINVNYDQVSIRGSNGYSRGAGSRVLMLFDGIPLYSGDTGELIFQVIPVYEIERVEIVKGAGSALYGSSAMGGVINIISKETSVNPIYYFKSFGGFYDKPYYDEWRWSDRTRFFNGLTFSHSRKIGDMSLSLSIQRYENDSYRLNNFTKRYNIFLKSKFNFTTFENLSFLLNLTTYRNGNFVFWRDSRNALMPPADAVGQTVNALRFNTHLSYQKVFSDDLLFISRASLFHNDWKDDTESQNSSKSDLVRAEAQVNYILSENHKFTSGIEGNFSLIESNIFGKPEAYGAAFFIQDEIKVLSRRDVQMHHYVGFPKGLNATLGGRLDYQKVDTAVSEIQVNPKLGLNFQLSDNLVLRASAGRGYRAPTSAELFTTTSVSGITVKPNPLLKSESGWSFEVGGNYIYPAGGGIYSNPSAYGLKFDVAIFQSEYYDLIEPGFDNVGQVTFDNITRARIQGVESKLTISLFDNLWEMNFGYSYLWARDLNLNKFLKYRPRHLLYISNNFKYDFVELGIDFRYWNRIENIDEEFIQLNIIKDGDLRDKVLVTDVRILFDLIHFELPLRLYLNVNNLFNYNYVELIGNVAPIRHFTFTLEGIL